MKKKTISIKVVLFFMLGILLGTAGTFCLIRMALPEQTPAVQSADGDISMADYARQSEVLLQLAAVNYKLSGTCGDWMNWYFTEEGTMYIQGIGDMWDYADAPLNSSKLPVPQWYDFRENITSLVVMPGVTSIGRNAFYKCGNLKECTFPDGLTEIREDAFQYCSGLTEAVLPDTVSEIGFGAFMGCENLTSVNIPSAVTKLSGLTFSRCRNLRQLSIPASINAIYYGCFSNCGNLTLVFEGSNPAWERNELNANRFFDNTRVEICYPASDESWKDFIPEDKGGVIYLTPYSGDTVGDMDSQLLLGDLITLGAYEQDDNPENGPEPIEWIVLAVTEEKVFLTTPKWLTVRSDFETESPVDWNLDKIKTWVNTEFYQSALPEEGRALIQSTTYDEISRYCKPMGLPDTSSDREPDLETCQVGFMTPTLSVYMDDSAEDSKMVFTDLLINPVIVVARDVVIQ